MLLRDFTKQVYIEKGAVFPLRAREKKDEAVQLYSLFHGAEPCFTLPQSRTEFVLIRVFARIMHLQNYTWNMR